MAFLKKIRVFSILFILFSCAKTSYIFDQGLGQLKLQTKARPNKEILLDPSIKKEIKEKIIFIEHCKEFFYKKFQVKENSIYSKTTFLDREAVLYLIVASPFNEIKTVKYSFPFLGEFPYLGFYDEKKAISFQEEQEAQNYITIKRPVYAYSTLGYFQDNILSSFFYFNKEELAEIIFHELFHTIYFIKDEVGLNENLANYFARELTYEYLGFDSLRKNKLKENRDKIKKMNSYILSLIKEFKNEFEKSPPQTKEEAKVLLSKYSENIFIPKMKSECKKLFIEDASCFYTKWNNASMASFLTYEAEADFLSKLREKFAKDDLIQYFKILKEMNEKYEDLDSNKKNNLSFSNFLKSKI